MNMDEKTIKSEKIFDGRIINVKVDTVQLCDGSYSTRELVNHPGGVAVVALDDEGYVYMVRQFRKPFERVVFEIPAGKLDYGEDHLSCGVRELEEETGLKAKNFEYLGEFMVSPGFCNELIHIYLATDLYKGTIHPDEGEFLEIEKHKLDDLIDLIMDNKISDAKTVIGLLKAKQKMNSK